MIVCGLDEVGRGALAGPIVGAAVILHSTSEILIPKLRDSKKLNKIQRENIFETITQLDTLIKVEIISARLINTYGIGWANKEIFRRLILQLQADHYIVDGNLRLHVRGKTRQIESRIKADAAVPEVMAASIVAKVTRDRLMQQLAERYRHYGWESNVGYGTKKHIEALRTHGSCSYHRTMFVETALQT